MLTKKELLENIEQAGNLLKNDFLTNDEFASLKKSLFLEAGVDNITHRLANALELNDDEFRISLINEYIQAGADVNGYLGDVPLIHILCSKEFNNLDILKRMIKAGVNVNMTDRYDNTVLHLMAEKEIKKIPEFLPDLLEAGIDINARNKFGKTALMLAAENYFYNDDCVKLLEAGADINIKDNNGKTAIEYADFLDSPSIDCLIKAEEKSNAEYKDLKMMNNNQVNKVNKSDGIEQLAFNLIEQNLKS